MSDTLFDPGKPPRKVTVGYTLRCNFYCRDHRPQDEGDLVRLTNYDPPASWRDDECARCGATLGDIVAIVSSGVETRRCKGKGCGRRLVPATAFSLATGWPINRWDVVTGWRRVLCRDCAIKKFDGLPGKLFSEM